MVKIKELENKHILVMMGSVGCGKSTLCNSLLHGTDSITENKDNGRFSTDKVIEGDDGSGNKR